MLQVVGGLRQRTPRRRDATAAVRRDHQEPDERAPEADGAGRDQGTAHRIARGRPDQHACGRPRRARPTSSSWARHSTASTSWLPTATSTASITAGGAFQDFGPAADIYDVSAILNPGHRTGQRAGQLLRPQGRRPRDHQRRRHRARRPATSAPTRSTRSPRRSRRPGRLPAPRGSPRTATTSWCRPSSSQPRATASR